MVDGLEISDSRDCRRYFGKFGAMTRHFHALAGEMSLEQPSDLETAVVEDYLQRLSNSFTALSVKYLLTGLTRDRRPGRLTIDQKDSGFPLFQEIVQMAADVGEAEGKLASLPERETLKTGIIDHVLERRGLPRDLQFAMSQRVYNEMLADVPLFLAQNPLQVSSLGTKDPDTRRAFCHWAVYDSQRNLPNIYLLYLEDSGARALARDEERWTEAAAHLKAQSLSSLKLLTIARGFDKDFPDLHPKLLRRLHVGPMYSNGFTRHADVVEDILAESDAEPGQDWVLCWTVETLRSKGAETESAGLFSRVQKEIYDLDPHAPEELEAGASAIERCMILPYRPYQRLVERDPPQLRPVRKYVVGPDGMVLQRA